MQGVWMVWPPRGTQSRALRKTDTNLSILTKQLQHPLSHRTMMTMGLDELLSALQKTRTIQDHPDWAEFKLRKLPSYVSFYYTNQDGQEAYWDQARIIKIDLRKLQLIIEG